MKRISTLLSSAVMVSLRVFGRGGAGVALLALAPYAARAASVPAAARPNILYLFTDDHSIRTLGCYADSPDAYPWVKTPNIDRLASEGVRFTYAYTGALCRPSRGSALTGRLQGNYTKETPYWPTKLRAQGYYTGMIGKWHWHVPQHGKAWDWSVVWPSPGDRPGADSDYYVNQLVSINGGALEPLGGYSTDRYTDYTVQFLKERAAHPDRPWYFWLCFAGVHAPYTPAERHLNDYKDAPAVPIPVDIFGPRPEKPANLNHFSRWTKEADGTPMMRMASRDQSFDAWVKQYNQTVRSLDEAVGRILQALADNGQRDNTIVIFTADQGFAWGQHGFRDKTAPYDANLRAPLIVSNPRRFPQGQVSPHPVSGPDIIKTIHRLTGLTDVPADGRDFSALLTNPKQAEWTDQPMIQMYSGGLYGNEAITGALKHAHESGDWSGLIAETGTGTRMWLMLRDRQYKYVRYLHADYIEELFDRESDPRELTNLALRQEHHPLLGRYRTMLLDAFSARGVTFLDLIPPPKVLDEPPPAIEAPIQPSYRAKQKSKGKKAP